MTKARNNHFADWGIGICKLFVVWNLFIAVRLPLGGIFIWLTPVPLFADGVSHELERLPNDVHQAVMVEAADGSITARVSGWEREDAGWRLVSGPVPAVVGRNRLAPKGEKREGDGRTPSGTFALRRAFGYGDGVQTGLVYRVVSEKDFWVDAPASPLYNRWVTGDVPEVSHEVLRRQDELYEYALVIEYNTDPVVAGMGSAIFLHVWRGADQPTAGCVAMARGDLLALLRWLDAGRNPVINIQGSRDFGRVNGF